MNSTLFSSLPLCDEILKNLDILGYQHMTPIQARSLPYVLKGQDVLAKAKTGSGKTAAFGLGLLCKLDPLQLEPQAMVICPTRELADQVSKEIRRLAQLTPNIRVLTLCGGKPFRMQAEAIHHGAHILVGTPGRLQDHIERKTLPLSKIKTLVLDEADRMLDMGFYDNIMDIIRLLPHDKQTLLFSATYPDAIKEISRLLQKDPVEISFENQDDSPLIAEFALQIREHEKNAALLTMMAHYAAHSAIIFCRTKRQCDDVAIFLCDKGYHALPIHSDFEQREREEVLLQFANQSCSILVATDVAARGLDIKDLPLVINYDMPTDPQSYVHRIGRTGRNGQAGTAISFFAHAETFKIEAIEEYTQHPIKKLSLESLDTPTQAITAPLMRTLCIHAGKKNKMRPGDILGALTGDVGLAGSDVGKIDIFDFHSYVAIRRQHSAMVLQKLQNGQIKGRTHKMRYLDN